MNRIQIARLKKLVSDLRNWPDVPPTRETLRAVCVELSDAVDLVIEEHCYSLDPVDPDGLAAEAFERLEADGFEVELYEEALYVTTPGVDVHIFHGTDEWVFTASTNYNGALGDPAAFDGDEVFRDADGDGDGDDANSFYAFVLSAIQKAPKVLEEGLKGLRPAS